MSPLTAATAGGCRPRRNGSTPAAPGQTTAGPSETTRLTWAITPGSPAIPAARRTRWGKRSRIRGASMTCTATFRNGAGTATPPDYYKRSPLSDPAGDGRADARVYRGGGWNDDAGQTRSASRQGLGARLRRRPNPRRLPRGPQRRAVTALHDRILKFVGRARVLANDGEGPPHSPILQPREPIMRRFGNAVVAVSARPAGSDRRRRHGLRRRRPQTRRPRPQSSCPARRRGGVVNGDHFYTIADSQLVGVDLKKGRRRSTRRATSFTPSSTPFLDVADGKACIASEGEIARHRPDRRR